MSLESLRNSAWELFEKGSYQDLIDLIRAPGKSSAESTALIGAFSFLGRLDEALEIWKLRAPHLSPPDRSKARFVLAITATRLSRFHLSRELLKENLNEATNRNPFVAQGIAFYFYYRGRFDLAAKWARRALGNSIEAEDEFMRLLATDLAAHTQIQRGRLSVGLRLFDEGTQLAATRGDSAILEGMRTSKLLAEAEAGFRPLTIVAELENRRDSLKAQDFYMRANLTLEWARQLTLRGRWQEARQRLDEESSRIYSFGNRRQEMALQLRLAELAYRQGDAAACGHFLRAARRCLHKIADQTFELRVLGLEKKLYENLFGEPLPETKLQELLFLSRKFNNRLNQQILSRSGLVPEDETQTENDPLHDLLVLIRQKSDWARSELSRLGYWGLWAEAEGLKPGTKAFFLRVQEPQLILVSPEVTRPVDGIGPQMIRLLHRLQMGLSSKEELIQYVWGYEYDPLRHDSLIHSALSSLRRALGAQGAWIQSTENGWFLSPDVGWNEESGRQVPPRPAAPTNIETPTVTYKMEDLPGDLSLRQYRALQELQLRGSWEIRSYREFFHVSNMTAFRDLDDLREKGYLVRHGKGRASCYLPARRLT